MENIQQVIMDFFTNEKMLKAVRSIVISLIILIVPLFYFGFKDTFDLEALFTWDFGVIVVIITFSIILATIETKSTAYDVTISTDNELQEDLKTIEDNSRLIRKKDRVGKISVKWLNTYNKEQQKMYDEILTNDKIDILEQKALNYRIHDKEHKAKKIDAEIKRLRKKKLKDRNFIPYSIKKVLNIEKSGLKFKRKKGNNEIDVNPKRVNWAMTFINMILRSSGVGVIGTIPFAVNESLGSVLLFYLGYILVVAFTIFTQYLLTTYVTTHSYRKSLREIINIQTQLIVHLNIETHIDRELEKVPFDEKEKDTN